MYPTEKTFLDVLPLKAVDAFLAQKCPIQVSHLTLQSPLHSKPMTKDQVKAAELSAKRCHRDGDYLRAGVVYIQLACRQSTPDDEMLFNERLDILQKDAQTQVSPVKGNSVECVVQFVHVGSASALKELYRRMEGIRLQQELLEAIEGSADEATQQLQQFTLSDKELFALITTHPILKVCLGN